MAVAAVRSPAPRGDRITPQPRPRWAGPPADPMSRRIAEYISGCQRSVHLCGPW